MIKVSDIEKVIKRKIIDSEEFIVDIYIKPANKIFIEIDSLQGITIDKCVEYTREIEKNFDREVEDYELQISSPGLDKPFKVKQQFYKNIGRSIQIITNEGQQIEGKLMNFDSDKLQIEKTINKKGEKTDIEIIELLFDNIKSGKALIKI